MGEVRDLTSSSTLLYFGVGSVGSVPEGFEELFVERLEAVRVSEKGILVPSVEKTDPLFMPDLSRVPEDPDYSPADLAYKVVSFLHDERDVLFGRFFNTRVLRSPLQIFKNFGDIGLVALDFSGTPRVRTSGRFERKIVEAGHGGSLDLIRALDFNRFSDVTTESPLESEGIEVVVDLDGRDSPVDLVEQVYDSLNDKSLIPPRPGEG